MLKQVVLLGTLTSASVMAEVPHTFSAGQPAVASEVNENFTYLDERIDQLITENANNSTSPTTSDSDSLLDSYVAKTAEIGDVIDTIQGVTYVLGAMPFSEYGTGRIYKVTLPIARYECDRTESSTNPYDGSNRVENYSCNDERQYYYESTVRTLLANVAPTSDLSISGFPAFLGYGPSMYSNVYIDGDREYIQGSWDDSVSPATRYRDYEITEKAFISHYHNAPSLNIQVNQTSLNISYNYQNEEPTVTATDIDAGPDFSHAISADDLNKPLDIAVLNQLKNLYNYISIEELSDI